MHTYTHNLHNVHIVRRIAASVTGALIALTVHSVYQDATAAVIAYQKHSEEQHDAAPVDRSGKIAQDSARIQQFTEALKMQRAQMQ